VANLLLIEDDDPQRIIAEFALRAAGHEVVVAADGRAGLEEARKNVPDLIVCDVMMPGMDGYEVVTTLRADPALAVVPVLMLTGMSGREHMRRGMTAGADDYLTKPYMPEELAEAVRALLRKRAAKQRAVRASVNEVIDAALQEQQEALGQRYEMQLAHEISARWTPQSDAGGDLSYPEAVLLQADLFGPDDVLPGEDPAERMRQSHQRARDTFYLFGADHVLAYGTDVLAVFASGASPTSPPTLRAARAALTLARNAPRSRPARIGLHAGPVTLAAVHDALHGEQGRTLVPGDSIARLGAMRDMARTRSWSVACAVSFAQGLRAESAGAGTTHRGDAAVELRSVPADHP